jgi:Holin of 3TMs, for gene-transfer release
VNVLADIVQGATAGATTGGASVVASVLDVGRDLIDRIFPDKTLQAKERAEAEAHLLDVTAKRESDLLAAVSAVDAAQSAVNLSDSASPSTWKSGWRPAIGWVCAGALMLNYWPRAIAGVTMWVMQCYQSKSLAPYPDLGVMDLLGLTASLLGMSTLRTLDKRAGVAGS